MKKINLLLALILLFISLVSCNTIKFKVINIPQEVILNADFDYITEDFEIFKSKLPNYKDYDATRKIDEDFFEKYYLFHFRVLMNKTEDINELRIEEVSIETVYDENINKNFDLLVFTMSIEKQYTKYDKFINGMYYYEVLVSLPKNKFIPGINYIYGFKIYDRQTNTAGSFYYDDKIQIKRFGGLFFD